MRNFIAFVIAISTTTAVCADPVVDSPVSPSGSLQHFQLSPELDLRIDLIACEPQVVDPVAIAFDEQARMFVVEMRDYPNGPAAGEKPLSQIKLLEDVDQDGRYETAHIFADKLLFATGILPWDGGVIVTLAGEVRFLKDGNGDLRVDPMTQEDVNEVWFSGFSEGNPQLRANHPTLGPDGWIFIANGLRGGKVKTVRPGWPASEIELRDHDFRFNPITGETEAITGGSQFGLTFNALGDRFICSNRNPCDHVVLEEQDLSRNPHLVVGKPIEVVAAAGNDSRVFPIADAWTTSTLHASQFTAACGVEVFTGDALPDACIGNVFTCEPTGSLVHREMLEPVGGTFRGISAEKDSEFLASRDTWFRPVNLTSGPDGALYIVDMYRAVIEHPEWMPEELKTREDLKWGDDRGRIYRVAAKDNTLRPISGIGESPSQSLDQLASHLEDENGWSRSTAFRQLLQKATSVEDGEKDEVAKLLLQIVRTGATPSGRQLALSLLCRYSPDLAVKGLGELLAQSNPTFHVIAARSINQLLPELLRVERSESKRSEFLANIGAPISSLARSDNARVRFEVARQLGNLAQLESEDDEQALTDALAAIAVRDADNHWTRIAVLSSATEPLRLYDKVVAKDADGAVPFLVELAKLIGRRKNETELTQFLGRLMTTGPEGGWALPILVGLGEGLGNDLSLAMKNAEPQVKERLDATFHWTAAVAGDSHAPLSQRSTAIAIVGLAPREFAISNLLELASTADPTVQRETIQTLGRFRGDERVAPTLLKGFSEKSPSLRSTILDAVLADPERVIDVVRAVEAGELAAAELGATRVAAISRHPDSEVRSRVQALFAPPAERQAVLAQYEGALTKTGDPKNGREIFQKNCATCHRIGDIGIQVGPDIADSRVRTPEALLTDVLDPNRAIDGRYIAFTVVLKDGTVQTGLVESETSSTVTLAQADGKRISIARDEIELMQSDGKSLMPVGIERSISPSDMADLISFIKNWRYLDGAVPLRR